MIFPPCSRAGRVVTGGHRRFCSLNPPARLVTLETCLACPHAGKIDTELYPICRPPARERTETVDCVHRGDVIRFENCQLCGQIGRQMPVHTCQLHGECTPARYKQTRAPRVCLTCPDILTPDAAQLPPLDGPTNLVWFIWPRNVTRELWLNQFNQIKASLPQFDGVKVCAIAMDETSDQADDFIAECRTLFDVVHVYPNDAAGREVPGWRFGMERMQQEPGFTVWLHAKGVYRGVAELHLDRWWRLAYETVLHVPAVRSALDRSVIAGCFRRNQYAKNLDVPWHFAGTFYAVRNSHIQFPASHAGGWYAEAWPALIATHEQAACLRFDGVDDLYQARHWKEGPA